MKKAALVTGAAKRIGRVIALHLASLGFDIALHYNTSPEDAQSTNKEILKRGVDCRLFRCDLTKTSAASRLISSVKKEFPHLNFLINSASFFEKSDFTLKSLNQLDKNFNVHLNAPYILTSEFARLVRKGQVINILDTNVLKNKTPYFNYLLSKKSLAELTKLAAVRLAPHIRVNAIAPGLILPPAGLGQDHLKRLAQNIPLKEKGSPEHISQTVEFLIQNDFITGQTIFVDGGEHLI